MNMKKSIVMLALALAMGSTQAEAKTQVEEQVVSVGEFNKISTTGNIDVVYSQGNTHSVVIHNKHTSLSSKITLLKL